MKKISTSNLKEIFKREIKFLIDGISNSSNPYHFFSLSTLNKDNIALTAQEIADGEEKKQLCKNYFEFLERCNNFFKAIWIAFSGF